MRPSRSWWAQIVFDLALKAVGTVPAARKATVLNKRRELLERLGDPLVSYTLGGMQLLVLPIYRRLYPDYSAQAARIAAHVKSKYPALTFIDVGANVGDTLSAATMEILAYRLNWIDPIDAFHLIKLLLAQIQRYFSERL